MAKIRTFARIKPSENLYDDFETTRNRLYLRIPDSYSRDSTLYNRTRAPIVNHEFKYSQVFAADSGQEEVFNLSAKGIIDGFLEGYNGTIFAYGQTSSGKTYTMQGDLGNSEDKGLAPRSLTRIFATVKARKEAGENITVHCSFLEIYQEVGYDLFKTVAKNGPGPTSFAKVTVVDGPQGAAVVKNLSIHAVNSEDAAQTLLAQGEFNRKVAETAMNNRSSRSHAVFTVYLSSRKGDLLVRSKMHFVDLAGSERVCKTGVKGLQLSEAKYINLSLHYLEGVIIALHQDATSAGRVYPHTAPAGVSKSWSASTKRPYSAADTSGRPRHIPYRNSLLTMLLKDSLGGNCLTTMIATISLDLTNLSESISTCRFAQRVSCISNTARKNEEIDDKSMIKRLRTRVAELEAENNLLKHGGQGDPAAIEEQEKLNLSAEDKELCQHVVKDFLNGRLVDPIVAGVTDPFKFRECMSIFKRLIKEHNDKSIRLAEKLKQQPAHIQEAFYTGGRYHEAPLAKPSRRQEISFRDDSNNLTKNAYTNWSSRQQRTPGMPLKPTILKSARSTDTRQRDPPTEAWQLQLSNERSKGSKKKQVRIAVDAWSVPVRSSTVQTSRAKPQSAGAALRTATPYERKRNQEVTQLNKKVEASFAQQSEQTNHLLAFKKAVVEQELELAIQSLSRKHDVSEHQLADQHAYTLRLQKQNTDPDLTEQELLVETHLHKRVMKIELQMNELQTKLQKLRSVGDTENNSDVSYRTVKEKFSDMTKRDGSLDTVKVKTTLQQQHKAQNMMQKKIDQERALVIEKHLEVQEISTRQKLQEFKQKLAESQSRQGQRINGGRESQSMPVTPLKQIREHQGHVQPDTQQRVDSASPSSNIKTPQKTFQHRIEQQQPSREESIGKILSKYRTSSDNPAATQQIVERTARVDHILAKYKAERKTTSNTGSTTKKLKSQDQLQSAKDSRSSKSVRDVPKDSSVNEMKKGPSHTSGPSEHKSKPQQTSKEYISIKVPNSAMEYKAVKIGSSSSPSHRQKGHHGDKPEGMTNGHAGYSDGRTHQQDFQSTLNSMLQTRQGNHKKRTDAWAETNSRQPEYEKQLQLKKKLQQFLSKQYRKKQQDGTLQIHGRSQSKVDAVTRSPQPGRSEQTARPAQPSRSAQPSSNAASRRPSRGIENDEDKAHRPRSETSKKAFSHRMSHYQTKAHNNPAPSRNDIPVPRTPETSLENDKTAEIQVAATTVKTERESQLKQYNNLRKLTKRNEHTMKVRMIRSAVVKIQRAWRRHQYQIRGR